MACAGAFRGYILFHDQVPIAYVYCRAAEDALIYQTVGYDPAFSRSSPGTVLLYKLIEDLFIERRFRLLDFFEGVADYKNLFATRTERCCRVYVFRRTARLTAMVLSHVAFNKLTNAPLRMIQRMGFKEKLKKIIRRVTVKR
jgi:CelD/BcsL family acetyltransferase involved in cellulose biosynthesis